MDPNTVIMLKRELVSDLLKSWPVIVFFAGAIFQAGGTFYMIREHSKQIRDIIAKNKELENALRIGERAVNKDIVNRLYDEHSQPLYMPVNACVNCRTECERQRTKEMNYLANELRTQTKAQEAQAKRQMDFMRVVIYHLKKSNGGAGPMGGSENKTNIK